MCERVKYIYHKNGIIKQMNENKAYNITVYYNYIMSFLYF